MAGRRSCFALALLASATHATARPAEPRDPVTWQEITALPPPPPGRHMAYGPGPLHFGELRLPTGKGPHPVAVVIHGGCWRSAFGVSHVAHASDALRTAGIATWSVEYRRVGDPGGGWPGTFEDIARGISYVFDLAREFPLDPRRVVLVGHSAGGHLALWAAGRHKLLPSSPLRSASPLRIRGVVALAGITDLRDFGAAPGGCSAAVERLLGGTAAQVPERYADASPTSMLPLGVPQRLLHGALDPIVPAAQGLAFTAEARRRGDDSRMRIIPGAGHFDLIAPFAPAWRDVVDAVHALLGSPTR